MGSCQWCSCLGSTFRRFSPLYFHMPLRVNLDLFPDAGTLLQGLCMTCWSVYRLLQHVSSDTLPPPLLPAGVLATVLLLEVTTPFLLICSSPLRRCILRGESRPCSRVAASLPSSLLLRVLLIAFAPLCLSLCLSLFLSLPLPLSVCLSVSVCGRDNKRRLTARAEATQV